MSPLQEVVAAGLTFSLLPLLLSLPRSRPWPVLLLLPAGPRRRRVRVAQALVAVLTVVAAAIAFQTAPDCSLNNWGNIHFGKGPELCVVDGIEVARWRLKGAVSPATSAGLVLLTGLMVAYGVEAWITLMFRRVGRFKTAWSKQEAPRD